MQPARPEEALANPSWHSFESRGDLARTLAADIAETLRQAVRQRGKAWLVVSGGSTPEALFKALAREDIRWSCLHIVPADERWVPAEHEDSNEALMRSHLPATAATLHSLAPRTGKETLEEGAARLARTLPANTQLFDSVVLGMGADGHTASLFPHHEQLAAGLDPDTEHPCLAVHGAPKPPPERISLTAARLLATRQLRLHITGEAKRETARQALQPGASAQAYPIRHFLTQKQVNPVSYWAP